MQFSDRISAKGLGLSWSQWPSIYDHKIGETTQRRVSVRKRTKGNGRAPTVGRACEKAGTEIGTVSYKPSCDRNILSSSAFGWHESGGGIMQHLDKKLSTPASRVFDVLAYCRSQRIKESETRKLLRLVGRFASRLEIQMNLTNRPARFR
jgi:hypothetical protein